MDGRPLITRDLGNVPDEVPALFMRLLPLDAPTGEALVSSGWRQLGRVLVVVHPRFAYDQLWHTALETLAWLVAPPRQLLLRGLTDRVGPRSVQSAGCQRPQAEASVRLESAKIAAP